LFDILKTDQEVFYPLEVDLGDFKHFQNSPIYPSFSDSSSCSGIKKFARVFLPDANSLEKPQKR